MVAGNVREQKNHEIRFVTYLAPSIPRALFEALADHLQRSLGRERVSLLVETRSSGPRKGHECSSFGDEVDVAFMCAPSFVWLSNLQPPTAELLGVAPVFEDERNSGRPVYFCDVVVRDDAPTPALRYPAPCTPRPPAPAPRNPEPVVSLSRICPTLQSCPIRSTSENSSR